jgi:hypothetical protein
VAGCSYKVLFVGLLWLKVLFAGLKPVRFAGLLWLKVLFAGLL